MNNTITPKVKIELNEKLRIHWDAKTWEKAEKEYRELGLIKVRRSELFGVPQPQGTYAYSYAGKTPSSVEYKYDSKIRVLFINDLDDYRILHAEPAQDYNGNNIVRLVFNYAIFRVVPIPYSDSQLVAQIAYDTHNIFIPYNNLKHLGTALAMELKEALRGIVDPKRIRYKIAIEVI